MPKYLGEPSPSPSFPLLPSPVPFSFPFPPFSPPLPRSYKTRQVSTWQICRVLDTPHPVGVAVWRNIAMSVSVCLSVCP